MLFQRLTAASAMAVVMLQAGSALAAAVPMIVQADTVLSGPCVQTNQFKQKDAVVFRARVIDAATGEEMKADDLASVVAKLPDGSSFDLHFGDHPPQNATDSFWSFAWAIPADYPTGTLSYTIVATNKAGESVTFEPFKIFPSQLTIAAAE